MFSNTHHYRVDKISVVHSEEPFQDSEAYEIRKKCFLGMFWSVKDDTKDIVFSLEDLDKRLEELKDINHRGENVQVEFLFKE